MEDRWSWTRYYLLPYSDEVRRKRHYEVFVNKKWGCDVL